MWSGPTDSSPETGSWPWSTLRRVALSGWRPAASINVPIDRSLGRVPAAVRGNQNGAIGQIDIGLDKIGAGEVCRVDQQHARPHRP